MIELSDSESLVRQSALNLIDALSKHKHGDKVCQFCGKDTTPKKYTDKKRGLTNSSIYKFNLNGRLIHICSQCYITMRKKACPESSHYSNVNWTMDKIDEAEWLVSRMILRLKKQNDRLRA